MSMISAALDAPPICRMRPGRNIAALEVQLVAPGSWPAVASAAGAGRRDVVHLAAGVEAEDAAVGREEVARKVAE